MQTVDLTQVDSVMAQGGADNVSSRYVFVPTTEVVADFEKRGWLPVAASQVNVRKEERKGKQRHLVRLRHQDSKPVLNDLHPEIIIVNAHDGSASFQVKAGFFRLACSNGLIVSEGVVSTYRIKHIGYVEDEVRRAVEYIGDSMPRVHERVRAFDQVELTAGERMAFAESALVMRYGADQIERFSTFQLALPMRRQDSQPTLWGAYNAVQEKFEKGGAYILNEKKPGALRRSRPMKSVSETVRVNQGLWHLAEKMKELKEAA